ncbi:MAG TPA: asparagine--tRNA ligase [Kiritimatiellia bacterium]|nr:asparagine--tRNA ligase [Kiritimatiellia bacterium]
MISPAIRDLPSLAGQAVTLRGWLQGKRSSGKIHFLLIRDGTGVCQSIVEAAHPQPFAAANDLTLESSLEIHGTVRLDERAPGGCELDVTALTLTHRAEDYPISRKAHGIDFLMNHRHLWLRSPRQTAILRIRHTVIRAARAYFDHAGFTLIDTPILSPGAAEGAGTLFSVDYFGDEVFLAQTGQLYLESACMALGKVYCFGPTFRAEKSKTRRHLTEFWMIEPEIPFADLPALKHHAEGLISRILAEVLRDHRPDLALLGRDPLALERIQPPFASLTYSEAVDLLHSEHVKTWLANDLDRLETAIRQTRDSLAHAETEAAADGKAWKKEKAEQTARDLRETLADLEQEIAQRRAYLADTTSFTWGKDFGGDEETVLSRQFDQPLFITEYPREVKAFYMKRNPDNQRVVLNLDMLAPEGYGEIIGGSVREDQLDLLTSRMAEEGMDPAPYQWYLDLRRYGSIPHGGFGLGIERTIAWICGLKHVRETIPFPRLLGRIYP